MRGTLLVMAIVSAFGVNAVMAEELNLLMNDKLDMVEGKNAPTEWVGDKTPKTLVKDGILATLDQAVRIEVSKENRQHGFIYQFVSPKDGFKLPCVLIQGYVFSKIRNGAFIQIKFFKGKHKTKIVNLAGVVAGKWVLLKNTFPLEGADKVQVLCRYYQSKKYLGNVVQFGDISLSETNKDLNVDDFSTKKVKVVVLGDSTVQTYAPGVPIVGWGQLIGGYFKKDVGVHNHAMSGRSTKTFIQEGRLKKALKDNPNYALVQFGHNDSHGKGRKESTDANTDYKDYLRQYADSFAGIGCNVIFVTPMCRMTFGKNGKLTDRLQPYADAMKEVAKEKNCVLLDLHAVSMEQFKKVGLKCVKLYGGRGGTDRTHFSQKGAEVITALVVEELKKSGSPLAGELN